MRRSYVVPMKWMVIYEYEVPGRALNLSSTKLPRPWSPWGSSPWRKYSHGRTGKRTRDLKISSQNLWPLDHEAGHRAVFELQNWITYRCACKTAWSQRSWSFHRTFRTGDIIKVRNFPLALRSAPGRSITGKYERGLTQLLPDSLNQLNNSRYNTSTEQNNARKCISLPEPFGM
jgi:hypothetical protein